MSSEIDQLIQISSDLKSENVSNNKKYRILEKIMLRNITMQQLEASNLGRAVKRCVKNDALKEIALKVFSQFTNIIDVYFGNYGKDNSCINKLKKRNENESDRKLDKKKTIEKDNVLIKKTTKAETYSEFKKGQTSMSNDSLTSVCKSQSRTIIRNEMPLKEIKKHKIETTNTTSTVVNQCDLAASKFNIKAIDEIIKDKTKNCSDQKRSCEPDSEFLTDSVDLFDELPDISNIDTNELSEAIEKQCVRKDKEVNPVKESDKIDVTARYESNRRIWMPKSKTNTESAVVEKKPERNIEGIPESVVAQYSWKQLVNFEKNDRKILKQTRGIWERLFKMQHKSSSRQSEYESWRDAFLRVQKEEDKKFENLTAMISQKAKKVNDAQKKTKLLTECPSLSKRRRY